MREERGWVSVCVIVFVTIYDPKDPTVTVLGLVGALTIVLVCHARY